MRLLLSKMNIKKYVHNGNFGHHYDHILGISLWVGQQNCNSIWCKMCPKCAQILGTLWTHFGHFYAMGTYFEHRPVIVQTTVKSLDTFWA